MSKTIFDLNLGDKTQTTGYVPVWQGSDSGATKKLLYSDLLEAMGGAKSGSNSDITALTALSTPIPVSGGGTGSSTISSARLSLGVNLYVTSMSLATPPVSPSEGDTYVVGTSATGAWEGHDEEVAYYINSEWKFYVAFNGLVLYDVATSNLYIYNSSEWSTLSSYISLTDSSLSSGKILLGDSSNKSISWSPPAGRSGSTSVSDRIIEYDALYNCCATSMSLATPPVSPSEGDTYVVGTSATGAWEGHDEEVAYYINSVWVFYTPFKGLRAFNLSDNKTYFYTGSAWVEAGLQMAPQATVTYRNKLLNGNFIVNQRGVSGTVTLAAGAYGHDRWKAGSAGCTYTFAAAGAGYVITVTNGTLLQIVPADYIEGGTYVLSQAGTAPARVYQGTAGGSYQAAPLTMSSLSANTATTIEFSTGTIICAQFELGAVASPFEFLPPPIQLAHCQAFYVRFAAATSWSKYGTGFASSTVLFQAIINLPVTMWEVPSTIDYAAVGKFCVYDGTANHGATAIALDQATKSLVSLGITTSGLTVGNSGMFQSYANLDSYIGIEADN